MERIKRYRLLSLWKMFCILLAMCVVSSAQQGIAESSVDSSNGQKQEKPLRKNDETIQAMENIRLAKVYYAPNQGEYKAQAKGAKEIVSIQVIKKIQFILIGGLLFIVGIFFIPYLIPQFTSCHEKLHHVLETPSKTYKTIGQFPQKRSSTCTAMTDTFPAIPGKTEENDATMPENKNGTVAYHTIRCESILSPALNHSISRSSTTTLIRKFFQQSGFASKEVSDTELRVNSPLYPYRSYGEIPVYVLNGTVLNSNYIQQVYDRMKSLSQQMKMAFVVVTTPPEDKVYHQIYNYRIRHNFTIIPLSHLLVTKSVRDLSCAQELEEKLSISTGQCNLYAMNTPVADPLSCFGRGHVINQLLSAVHHQEHIRLSGLRKIGKTWLVWQFKEQLSHHIAAYINLQNLPGNCSYLYRKIIDDCVRDATFKYPDLRLPELYFTRANYRSDGRNEFVHDIVSLWKCVRTKQKDIKIILLLDEAEQLVLGTSDSSNGSLGFHEFLGVIRDISQKHGFLISIMASASPEIIQKAPSKSPNNPESQHYKRVFLSSLPEDECNQMINALGAQMGLIYTEESLSRLYYETGGHPYVTRQLCSLIAKNLKHLNAGQCALDTTDQATVQVRDVEQAVSEYIEYKSDYFESVWRQLSRLAQEIMYIIAKKDSCTLDDLIPEDHNHHIRDERKRAMSTLIENDLIEKCENKYSITMGLFGRLILASN